MTSIKQQLLEKYVTWITKNRLLPVLKPKIKKKGTLGQKRRPKGDPNPQKGPLGDPGPLKGTQLGTVLICGLRYRVGAANE